MSFWQYCLFVSSFGPKYQRKIWQISALAPKEWSNQNDKSILFYEIAIINIRKCLYICLFDHSLGAKVEICQIFSLVFLSKRWQQKDILKFNDL